MGVGVNSFHMKLNAKKLYVVVEFNGDTTDIAISYGVFTNKKEANKACTKARKTAIEEELAKTYSEAKDRVYVENLENIVERISDIMN